MLKAFAAETLFALSFTVTLKLNGLPVAVVGVPAMVPVAAFSAKPGGKLPVFTVQPLYGAVPPLAVSVCE